MIIVIDDERTFDFGEKHVVHLRTSQEALAWFAQYVTRYQYLPMGTMHPIDEIWFDHDLGEKSGDDAVIVAKFLTLTMKIDPSMFSDTQLYVHSQNPVGVKNIVNVFQDVGVGASIQKLPKMITTVSI